MKNDDLKALEKENLLLKTIMDCIHEGIFVTNENDEIILYNREIEKTEGTKREDVLGKRESEVYLSAEYNYPETVANKVLKTGKPILEQYHQYKLNNGHQCNVLYSAFPFYYEGKIAAVFSIGREINQIGRFISDTIELQKKIRRDEKHAQQSGAKFFLDDIVGMSDILRETILLARKVAIHRSPVLIVGETGTGKELFAHGIHNASYYAKGPFIPVNCAAIPDTLLESVLFGTVRGAYTGAVDIPGLFEQAEGGTIFLDEINSMPFSLQAKLLRVLQDRVVRRIGGKEEIAVNCRIISASNVDPFYEATEQVIRPDLFFRLATVAVNIPPLRERSEDIRCLSEYFINQLNDEFGLFINEISPELISLLQKYHWPGNVRELENIIQSAMNLVETGENVLSVRHIPGYFREKLCRAKNAFPDISLDKRSLHEAILGFEKKLIEETLLRNNNNVSKTARELEISRQQLHFKIKKYKKNYLPDQEQQP